MVDAMGNMAFQARNLSRGARIFNMMQEDKDCAVFLTLAGSLISAGLKHVIVDMIKHNMVDAIVSTGANIVDQDFFEALGFKHYVGTQFGIDDQELRELMIDRIYDTFIDEEDLRICDDTIAQLCNELPKVPHSSREFIREMGRYLDENERYAAFREDSIVWNCYKKGIPIFVPAFSDCSAGFGLVHHQWHNPDSHLSIDSAKDFLEITKVKLANPDSGLFMIGGGVPEELRAGHRGRLRHPREGGAHAQVRHPDHGGRRTGRRPVGLYPEGSLLLGQGGYRVRADDLGRGYHCHAAHRRLRVPQAFLERPPRTPLQRHPRQEQEAGRSVINYEWCCLLLTVLEACRREKDSSRI
jgi:deoxyhypusine synthase